MRNVSEFTIQDLAPLALGFVVAAVIIGYGAQVLGSVQSAQLATYNRVGCNSTAGATTACGFDYNVSQKGLASLGTFGDNLPLMATVVVAAIIIGILVVYLGGRALGR